MKHFGIKLAILTIAIFTIACLTAQAAKNNNSEKPTNRASLIKQRALAYAVPNDGRITGPVPDRIPLGTPTLDYVSESPGVIVGWTYYDHQQTASMGRMIETGPHSGETGPTIVHMGWMHLPDSVYMGRTYMYNAYRSSDHSFAGAYRLHDYDDVYSGYVNVDVTPDNRALVGGHADEKGPIPYQTQIHFDACPACELFDYYVRIPDSVAFYAPTGTETLWPRFFFQFGTDTVLHVIAAVSDVYDPQPFSAIGYYRRVGYEGSPDVKFDYPPYVIDTVNIYSYDITGQRNGDRVAISWLASLPYQEPLCDTCSGLSAYGGTLLGQMDNDIYYQVSNDQGATWEPRVNITQVEFGEAAFKAYADLSVLFDQNDYLHVVWTACPWSADSCVLYEMPPCFEEPIYYQKAGLFHWSENVPYIRTIADHTYEPSDSCGPPAWALTVAKPTISECDGKLYTIWSQFNDMPNGIDNDCAEWGYESGEYWGAANADIWVSASADNGMTWSAQSNLTNSYTPHCDPHYAEDCQSDYWASMSRWGREIQTGENWTSAVVVHPTGEPITDYYLDIQYVNDLDAGGVVMDEGSWTNSPIKWFRMPCFEPPLWIPCPPMIDPPHVGDPTYTRPGEQLDVDIDFANLGNTPLYYTYALEEDNGPSGWLDVSGLDGEVPHGLSSTEYGTIHLNAGGIITTTGNYYGRIHFEFNCGYGIEPADVEIELIVADTLVLPMYEIVRTNCLALTANSAGNMGREGYGRVNMDYVGYYGTDCDTTAVIYMYDGSPFVGRILGDDTTFTSSVLGESYFSDYGFRPVGGNIEVRNCLGGEVFQTGTFTTQDSAIAVSKAYLAPSDDCEFIVQYTKVWSFDGAAHDDLMIGEFIDWDVPWDYHADDPEQWVHIAVNTGGTDGPRNLLYQQGYESYGANGEDTLYPFNCQYNDERFAGNAFVESYLNGSFRMGAPYGGFIGENDSLVYPATTGIVEGAFWQDAIVSGLRGSDSTEDLHSAMIYEPSFDLGPTDVYETVTILATIQQGTLSDLQQVIDDANAWYTANGGMAMFEDLDGMNGADACEGCCQLVGDFNHNGTLDPLDIVAFINWMWRGGADPVCYEEQDFNCDCSVDGMDAVRWVGWYWRGWPYPGCTCEYLWEHCDY